MSLTRKVFKNILIHVLFYSGLPVLFREVFQRKKVSILVLHKPTALVAARFFEWLTKHYNIISLDQFLSYRSGSTHSLPVKSMVITFDDGHIENYDLVPLLKKNKIPVTIFLCSGIINTNRHFWFRYSGLTSSSDSFKVVSDTSRLESLRQMGFTPEKEFAYPQALNKMQITEMKEFVNFQGHTISHPCLPQCSDQKSLAEIEISKKQLEQEFDLRINALAYPNGDYTDREVRFAQQAGYVCAVTVQHGFNNKKTEIFKLRRLSVCDRDNIKLVALKASGVWAFLKYFFKK